MSFAPNFIDGKRVDSTSDRSILVWNPATGQQAGETRFSTEGEVDQAIRSAQTAAHTWGTIPVGERAQVMFAIRDTLIKHTDELAQLITAENGKTFLDARMEVRRGLESIEYACGLPELLKGQHSLNAAGGIDVLSLRQPLGVVACITPFNFPVMVPLWMMANALAAGNTVVLKPSEKTPSATVRMVELLSEAGLPTGVVNLVQGDKAAVDQLLADPRIDGVSFIGSTPIAKYVYENAAASGKRVQALGGAKNHVVVMPDADLDAAAQGAVAAAFGAAGERCMAISVLVAVGDVGDELVRRITKLIQGVKVGDGMDEGTDLGPLITREHRDRVASFLDAGRAEGAEVVVDGRDHPVSQGEGFFLHPSVIDKVTPDMSVYLQEIFGPVLSVMRADDLTTALRLVNEHVYGNGAVVYTRDGRTARDFQLQCKAGMVGVNVPIPTPVGWFSFGGWKSSLFGDAHMYGPDGLRFFTRQKVVTTRWT